MKMALQKITYENKVPLIEPTVANINRVSDTDMNEIKSVVNAICDTVDANTTDIGDVETRVDTLEEKTAVKAIIDVVYPVGSIYITKDSTNPGTTWPGTTWTREAEGRCIIGLGTGYPTAGDTGGSSTVTLTINQIPGHTHKGPSHTHSTPNHTHSWSGTTSWAGDHTHTGNTKEVRSADGSASNDTARPITSSADHYGLTITNGAGGHNHTISGTTSSNNGGNTGASGTGNTGSAGGGQAHSNMQPYIVMYIWRRTA